MSDSKVYLYFVTKPRIGSHNPEGIHVGVHVNFASDPV